MTKKERIAALEARIAQLEARLARVEARPYWYWSPYTAPYYTVTAGGTGTNATATDGTTYAYTSLLGQTGGNA